MVQDIQSVRWRVAAGAYGAAYLMFSTAMAQGLFSKKMPSWSDFCLDLRALAVFRFALGVASLVEIMELMLYHDAFLEKTGVCPVGRISNTGMIDLYLTSMAPIWLLLVTNFVAALFFALGFWTKCSAVVCWLFAASQHHRLSNCVEYGGDHLRSNLLFWSLFQPLGHAWSLDTWICFSGEFFTDSTMG